MKITFCCADTNPQPWLQGLSAALPDATISLWQPGAPLADYAVVWAPPQTFFNEQTQLKAIFNTGAGVDALMKLDLPAGEPVIRLDDAGMAVQMAEYVCHALIRHFREFEGYEADMAQGTWSYREPRDRADFPVGIMGLGVLGERVARAVAAMLPPGPVVVGCSGGADSTALALGARWAAGRAGTRMSAVVIDHGLQPGSRTVALTHCGTTRPQPCWRAVRRFVTLPTSWGTVPRS